MTERNDRDERRGRATALAFLAAAGWMFVYEATKQAFLPGLSAWQSHTITIIVSACTAAAVTYIAIVQQSRILQHLANERAKSERLEGQRATLAHSEARYRLLVEASPEAIVVHRAGRILYVNAAAVALIGARNSNSVAGMETADFIVPSPAEHSATRSDGGAERSEYRLVRHDGGFVDVESASVGISYESEPAVQTVLRDVTERRVLEARLVHDAFHDPLTTLPNRRLFRDRIEHALSRLPRAPQGMAVTVLFLDLDNFKTVNDTLGHDAGDRLLITVAQRLQAMTRNFDTVARLGGDEFGVLLEDQSSEPESLQLAERIRDVFRTPVRIDGLEMHVTASIGVAHAAVADDADVLLRNADVAMYEAKKTGKSRLTVFAPEMYHVIVERLTLESELRAAMADPAAAGFALVYQPIVELGNGAVRGMEALLRWQHPARGLTSPVDFIPLAEQTGLIVPLGTWVLRQACLQLEAWRKAWAANGRDPESLPSVTVNISGRQLQEPDFAEVVEQALRLTLAPPRCVTLEITETVIMHHTDATLATLHQLKARGLRLAIDDFGTGYSSLSYLQRFPVDVLKIDRSFVDGVARAGSGEAFARTIIAMGQSLGLRTVAEGVESTAQRDVLRRLGCQLGQGYLFARPMTSDAATAWLAEQHESPVRRRATSSAA